jgi:1,4-dihydroxy-2-naphthoate octaprenyltransferase
MRYGIAVVICLASIAGLVALWLCWKDLPYHGIELISTGLLCIIFAFLYTYGLSYMGLGDVLVLHEVSFKEYFGHTYYKDLEKLAEKYPVLAYHCDHREAPEDCRLRFAAVPD